MPVNNAIVSFEVDVPLTSTKVTVATTHGLLNTSTVEIMNSTHYQGTYEVTDVTQFSFVIPTPFVDNQLGCVWQISRIRPAIVNVTGESIDTFRQAVNQISSDLGNKLELSTSNKKNLVDAINESTISNLIISIALN